MLTWEVPDVLASPDICCSILSLIEQCYQNLVFSKTVYIISPNYPTLSAPEDASALSVEVRWTVDQSGRSRAHLLNDGIIQLLLLYI